MASTDGATIRPAALDQLVIKWQLELINAYDKILAHETFVNPTYHGNTGITRADFGAALKSCLSVAFTTRAFDGTCYFMDELALLNLLDPDENGLVEPVTFVRELKRLKQSMPTHHHAGGRSPSRRAKEREVLRSMSPFATRTVGGLVVAADPGAPPAARPVGLACARQDGVHAKRTGFQNTELPQSEPIGTL
jgi:hypothetical protein